jgi:glycosyltransferase involved in cell wall biosynthesis
VYVAGPVRGPHGEAAAIRYARPLGSLDQQTLAGWLAARPIFVSPALYEPFGLAVLEAAQAGCPLVLSDIPSFRELWDDAALFVPSADPDALGRALETLARDGDLRTALGQAGQDRAARYTVDAMTAGVLRAYRAIAPAAFAEWEAAA